jgi:hypothetical protein
MTPLNVIWRRTRLEFVRESYFMMNVLLGKLGRAVRVVPVGDHDPLPLLHDMLIVSYQTELDDYLRAARAQGCRNLGLFHMADERGTDDRAFYAEADYVIRHYWFRPAVTMPNERSLGVIWVPNGFGNGIGPVPRETILPMRHRHVSGFFSGAMDERRDERHEMIRCVEAAKLPFQIVKTPGFGQGFGPPSYAAYLNNARFALVPAGNSPETIRLYDALETGAIPIMVRSEFATEPDALGNPPLVLLDRWSDLSDFYARYADAASSTVMNDLQDKQDRIVAWWRRFVERQQTKIKTLIDSSFDRSAAAGS